MNDTKHRLPIRRTVAVAALAMLAAACIFAPGKFNSQLDLKKDHSFAFRYTGEILMVPLMKNEKDAAFEPSSCHDEESLEERTCSDDELAQQKTDWGENRAEKKKSDAQAAKMLLGGIDPSDPESGKELAEKLRRQAGWKKVEYLGDGKFDVDFAISGKIDHDFIFPTFEGFPMSNAFIQVFARQDGTVRIDAPGFGPQSGSGAMAGMMAGMAQDGASGNDGPTSMADGTFAVFTNGEVLANNTDEGASSAPGGKLLSWKVNPRTAAAPTALVKLSH
ncbi:hypothetical protein V474_12130 [Novosphingobium barchaimii LL02]|uniref:Lipoprotein n=1 Tax=Novosphingobium barchaimii LL02 TaxID=1114963 RepID=A0A0J7Y8G6_9SPHN|nr:hypothetical protein [Novosphingobium barchaimii]KMS59912.1 hypothetical protein V474_12130 [Novosphingobium barchaimii LL02]